VLIEHPPGCRAAILANPARGRLEVRLDPASPQTSLFPKLCEFVDDLFERQFVRHKAKNKRLPNPAEAKEIQSRFPPHEYATASVIYAAIVASIKSPEKSPTLQLNYAAMTKWSYHAASNIRNNGIKGKGRLLHIDDMINRFKRYYSDKMGRPLDSTTCEEIKHAIWEDCLSIPQ